MFNFSASAVSATVRTFAGAAAAAVLVAASPAAAGNFFVGDANFFDFETIGQTPSATVRISPFLITGNDGTTAGALDDYLAFCIQLDVAMFKAGEDVGGMGDAINALYADETLLSDGDLAAVGKLVNYGTAFFNTGPFTGMDFWAASDELAAVQVAIWKITNPLLPVNFDPGFTADPAGNDLRATGLYTAAIGSGNFLDAYTGSIRTIYTRGVTGGFDRQGLAFAGAAPVGVPEPLSWALMIMGFAAAGGVLRLQRRRVFSA